MFQEPPKDVINTQNNKHTQMRAQSSEAMIQNSQSKQKAPAIRLVDSIVADKEQWGTNQSIEPTFAKSPIKQNQVSKIAKLSRSRQLMSSGYQFDFANQLLNSEIIYELNPLVKEELHNHQERNIVIPSKVVSDVKGKGEARELHMQKCFSEDITTSTEQKARQFFVQYQQKLAAVYIMHSLIKQSSALYESENDKSLKLVLQYLLSLKGLLLLLKLEKTRRDQKIELEDKCHAVEACKKLIQQLYERDLKKLRQMITNQIFTVAENKEYHIFANKILESSKQLYSIFTLEEIEPVYRQILNKSYELNNEQYSKRKSELRLRLGLILFLCLNVEELFSSHNTSQLFAPYFEYTKEKVMHNVVLSGKKLEDYIFKADYVTIFNHHKLLRKQIKRPNNPKQNHQI